MGDFERRERDAQREVVDQVLPDTGEGSVLRLSSGEVLVYDDGDNMRRPVTLRAAVMPDGELLEFETNRFERA